MSPVNIQAEVLAHGQVGPDMFLLGIRAPEIRNTARPGQFCMIDTGPPGPADPLLRRPLSIHRVGPKGLLIFLYRVVGKGTSMLSRLRPGDPVGVLGPLGRGFRVAGGVPGLIVGGGMGVAPLVFLAESWAGDRRPVVLFGGRTREELAYAARCIEDVDARPLLVTEDGSMGERGLVTDLVPGVLEGMDGPPVIYACGPWPMMKAVWGLASGLGIPCQVSLEARMACGIGICLGCAVKARSGEGDAARYIHVCKDGPVVDAVEVDWDHEA